MLHPWKFSDFQIVARVPVKYLAVQEGEWRSHCPWWKKHLKEKSGRLRQCWKERQRPAGEIRINGDGPVLSMRFDLQSPNSQ